jgi:hypothetical protein
MERVTVRVVYEVCGSDGETDASPLADGPQGRQEYKRLRVLDLRMQGLEPRV